MIELDLRDIHIPDSLPWWPLAPGWWMLMMLVVMLVAVVWWYRRWRRNPLRQASLRELAKLRNAFAEGASQTQMVADICALLRRIAISRYGRVHAAGLTGNAWLACLCELAHNDEFDSTQLDWLTWNRYRQESNCDIDGLLRACEKWIRNLPKEGKHVSA